MFRDREVGRNIANHAESLVELLDSNVRVRAQNTANKRPCDRIEEQRRANRILRDSDGAPPKFGQAVNAVQSQLNI